MHHEKEFSAGEYVDSLQWPQYQQLQKVGQTVLQRFLGIYVQYRLVGLIALFKDCTSQV